MKPLGCFGHGCKLRSTRQGGVKVLTRARENHGLEGLGGRDELSKSEFTKRRLLSEDFRAPWSELAVSGLYAIKSPVWIIYF